jgi:hypothetical protein
MTGANLNPFLADESIQVEQATPEIGMKCTWLGILLMGIAIDAQASGGLADIQIMDRDTGSVLPMYRCRGEYCSKAQRHRSSDDPFHTRCP